MKRAGLFFAAMAVLTFCLGPFLWQVLTSLRPEGELHRISFPSSLSLAHYRALFAGRPFAGVYLWFRGSRQASTATSTIQSGVGKSGSPAPNPMTSSPAAWSALALVSTARVAEGVMAASRADVRFTSGLCPDRRVLSWPMAHQPQVRSAVTGTRPR